MDKPHVENTRTKTPLDQRVETKVWLPHSCDQRPIMAFPAKVWYGLFLREDQVIGPRTYFQLIVLQQLIDETPEASGTESYKIELNPIYSLVEVTNDVEQI